MQKSFTRQSTQRPSAARRLMALFGASLLLFGAAACLRDAPNQPGGTGGNGGAATCVYKVSGGAAKPVDPPSTKDVANTGEVVATMEMAAGTVKMTMNRANAPCAVHSFESLAAQDFFNDTKCHRLVDTGIFVLQCGDPSGSGRGGPGYSYADELTGKEKYPRGTVAMANAGKNTNGSQFFIVWEDTELKPDYVVLGTVDEASLKVITSIASQGVDASDGMSPIADASIKSVTMG